MTDELAIRIAALDAASRLYAAVVSGGEDVSDKQVVVLARQFEDYYLRSGK